MFPKRPRLDPVCYIGIQRYFVTICADYRHHAFTTSPIVVPLVEQFLRAADEEQFAVIAYVFMPDHAHALVEGLDATSDLQLFMQRAKQLTGYAYKQRTGRKLWQPGFWDRVLRAEEATWDVIRYVCENPVRKGIVQRWDEYEFVGSGTMTKPQLAEELIVRPVRVWRP